MAAVRAVLGWLALLAAGVACAEPPAPVPVARSLALDTAQSRFGFEIRTRLGQRIEGVFPRFEGRIEVLSDGRHQVHLRMFTRYVEIPGKPRYTGWMRGDEFFDADRYPVVEFDSVPYWPEVVDKGGAIEGRLILRGVSHPETLRVEKAEC
ncbi:MAG TPA: hypothetical protein DEB32_02290, partial [Stenotrophomonas sp.]|nr:hypothetical protein [Stenotrophomonas sp.]